MEIAKLYDVFKASTGICTDTRKLKKGQMYFALKGGNFNGNLFAEQALKDGAACAVVDEEVSCSGTTYVVDDALSCLQELANYHRRQFDIPFLGITGSNGKTTTKEMLAAVLSKKYKVHATKGNFNNHIGVPLTLLELDETAEFAIVEMGANHIGEIAQLCEIAEPDFGLITNIGTAHIEGFGSAEGVARGKSELYLHVLKSGTNVFYNADDEQLSRMAARFKSPIPYLGSSDYCSPTLLKASPFVSFEYGGEQVESNTIGAYNFTNMASAMCVGKYFEVDQNDVVSALATYTSDNNRSQVKETENNTIILDAYNANPSSMEASLDNFAKMETANKVLILGDMYELGTTSEEEHQRIADLAGNIDGETFLIGTHFSKVQGVDALLFEEKEQFQAHLLANKINGSTILLKGSRGMTLESLISSL